MNEMNGNNAKKILVTGGSGLLGSHLIGRLVQMGCQVSALYRSHVPAMEYADKVNWIQCDILDMITMEETMESITEVYHCAAMVSFVPKSRQAMMQTNVAGTANVVNAALTAGVHKLCYVSSVAALGKNKTSTLINEDAEYNPNKPESAYSESKYLAETEVWRAIGEGLPCVIINPSIILGTGEWTHGSTQMFKSAYESFPWYAEGTTGFADVKDVVNAMVLLMERNITGERFIVSAENKTYREVFKTMADAFGTTPPYKKVTPALAAFVWRMEAIKAILANTQPLITKETAQSAFEKTGYDNSKLKKFLPSFTYTPIDETIKRVCNELRTKYKLTDIKSLFKNVSIKVL